MREREVKFVEDLGHFFSARQYRLSFEQDREQLEAEREVKALTEGVEQCIQGKQLQLFRDLQDAINNRETLAIGKAYQQGFRDGVKMIIHSISS